MNFDDFVDKQKQWKAEKTKSTFETKTKICYEIRSPLDRACVGVTIPNIIKKGEIKGVGVLYYLKTNDFHL